MNKYTKVAIVGAEELRNMRKEEQKKIILNDLWKEKCRENKIKEVLIKKGYPRLTIIDLYENNLITKRIDKKNIQYTIQDLWEVTGKREKNHNSKMGIVLTLCEKGVIR